MKKLTKKQIIEFIKKDICEIPILYKCPNIAYSVAEDFKNRVCVPCWYDCREIFHADYPISNHIFINHNKRSASRLVKFIKSMEEHLGLRTKTKIFKTVKKTATLLILSPFWKEKIKFSLLTLLLRAAIYNRFILFDISICSRCKYLNATKNAVVLFFSGRKTYLGDSISWYGEFKYKKIKECKELLV
jgi:hypothetical protein